MHAGRRGQGGETRQEIERREGEGSDVVLPSALEVHGDVAVREFAESLGGDDGTGEVTKETLEGVARVGWDDDSRMDVEAARAPGRERLLRAAG